LVRGGPTLTAFWDDLRHQSTPRLNLLRGPELHRRLEVMGLARYYFSTPRYNLWPSFYSLEILNTSLLSSLRLL